MKRPINILFSCLLAIGIACSKDEQGGQEHEASFSEKYGGQPYTGEAKGELLIDGKVVHTFEGKGTVAAIEPTNDSISLVFRADFDASGEITFKVRGQQRGENFFSENEAINFRIVDQEIEGEMTNSVQQIHFSGDAREKLVFMDMNVLFLENSDPFPKGSTLKLAFRTSREVTDSEDGEGCQMRLVPIWSPNGMTMGMVPDC
ncbi:hypothetical protein [Olivibacter sitiensis]|uniref:hypothetical protein n=1 Tax=Olivibacter sitiensis TaxID=376470 RepID=UPI00041193B3|nr:hypothetical protein [Olivibacter sitiensis]